MDLLDHKIEINKFIKRETFILRDKVSKRIQKYKTLKKREVHNMKKIIIHHSIYLLSKKRNSSKYRNLNQIN